jgi:hypothetical protein
MRSSLFDADVPIAVGWNRIGSADKGPTPWDMAGKVVQFPFY